MDKLSLLRNVVANLHIEPLTPGVITQNDLDQSPFARARLGPQGYVGVLKPGGEALSDLAETVFRSSSLYQRGCTFEELSSELFSVLIQSFLDRKSAPIGAADVTVLERAVEEWFGTKSRALHLYVPCILTPRPAPVFHIGPVRFTYLTDFVTRHSSGNSEMFSANFASMLQEMQTQRAFWIAEVDVARTMPKRGRELGELAVDLAIAGMQLLLHPDASRHMSRLTARTVPRYRFDVSESTDSISPTVTNQEPGILLAPGTLEHFLREGRSVIAAVGQQVSAFLDFDGVLPTLARAWADGAYWYHEGLAEPLDTIAIAKLETAIEVLLRSEKLSGSEARVRQAIHAFYGLKPDDFINPNSTTTVKQFAKGFVRDRSMVLHGTISTLLTSLRTSRGSLEGFVCVLLTGYALELQAYAYDPSASDNLARFLTFVESRRSRA